MRMSAKDHLPKKASQKLPFRRGGPCPGGGVQTSAPGGGDGSLAAAVTVCAAKKNLWRRRSLTCGQMKEATKMVPAESRPG